MQKYLVLMLVGLAIAFGSCDDDTTTPEPTQMGTLKFKTSNSVTQVKGPETLEDSMFVNPDLRGDTTATYTTSMLLCIGDVWVSQGEVVAGGENTLEWVRLTANTNKETQLFEDYYFTPQEIPAGDYKSIKITFRNVFYRYAQLIEDSTVKYQLLETMGSWTDPCDENDTSWAKTNYFGPGGNHILNEDNNTFELVTEKEKLAGFKVDANKIAVVNWRLYGGADTPCTTYLIDKNFNRKWDCGTDRMDFDCPPDLETMWDFVIEYE